MAQGKNAVRQLRKMIKEPASRAFLGWLSEYSRNADNSAVDLAQREATRWGRDNIDPQMVVSRSEVISVMRQLEELQLGRFIVGRRGAESRFEFWSSRVQIGQAAMGVIEEIDIEEEPVSLEENEIIEAHRMLLANSLDKPISAIKIKIRE